MRPACSWGNRNVTSGLRAFGFVVLIALALGAGAVLLPASALPRGGGPRDVRLIARDMTFYLEGAEQPNPTLRFRAGEEIRLVLRNDDAGMDHDFAIRTWGVATGLLEGKGETAVTFRVPGTRGSESYACSPHSQMMRGTIEIE
jgi:hypothetical protein